MKAGDLSRHRSYSQEKVRDRNVMSPINEIVVLHEDERDGSKICRSHDVYNSNEIRFSGILAWCDDTALLVYVYLWMLVCVLEIEI